MLWFNRILWPLIVLILAGIQLAFYRAARFDGIALIALIQLGIGVFIWHDWRKLKAP